MRNSERQLGENTERRPPRTAKVLGALLMWLEGDRECLMRWGGLRGSRTTPSQNGPPRDQSFLQNQELSGAEERVGEDAVSHSTSIIHCLSPLAETRPRDPGSQTYLGSCKRGACIVARACVCLLREVVYPGVVLSERIIARLPGRPSPSMCRARGSPC